MERLKEIVAVACESCGTFVDESELCGCEQCARMVCEECSGASGDYCLEHDYMAEEAE